MVAVLLYTWLAAASGSTNASLVAVSVSAPSGTLPAGATASRAAAAAYGRGFAFATYVHGTFPGTAAASAAWVCDVTVDLETGEVALTRVFVGQDQGLVINPDGVRHQLHGNVVQSLSRVLKEQVRFDESGAESREWGSYPLLTFPELPEIDVLLMERQEESPMGAGESASIPCAAAIANALFDATGVRFYTPPFTPEKVSAALRGKLER